MMTGLNHCARPLQIQGRVHETAANDGDCERNSEASIASSSQTSREAPAQPHFTPTSAASPASFVPTLTPHKKVKKVCLYQTKHSLTRHRPLRWSVWRSGKMCPDLLIQQLT
jgi:hypothetical protein